jgi:hypothetical protein
VTPDIADVTTTNRGHSWHASATICTTWWDAPTEPTDVPPNFITKVLVFFPDIIASFIESSRVQ